MEMLAGNRLGGAHIIVPALRKQRRIQKARPGGAEDKGIELLRIMQDIFRLYIVFIRLYPVIPGIGLMEDIIRIDPDIDRSKDRDQNHCVNQSLDNIFFHCYVLVEASGI